MQIYYGCTNSSLSKVLIHNAIVSDLVLFATPLLSLLYSNICSNISK